MFVKNGIESMKIFPIKEDRLQVLLKILECIDKNKFNREGMKKCILNLYPNKSEKSVFRGIAIPTLRRLGLIVGYDEAIRPSSNGRLLLASMYSNNKSDQNLVRIIFLEIDRNQFGFMDVFKKSNFEIKSYLFFKKNIEGAEEYKRRWLKILNECGLIKTVEGKEWVHRRMFLAKDVFRHAANELNYKTKKKFFKQYLFNVYKELSLKSAGIVDIEDLRGEVALKVLKVRKEIITEEQFDNLLRVTPLVTDEYIVSLGQPMGAEEKLFELGGQYYRTLSIKFFDSKEVEK
jgi:hypothetical protein